MRPRQFAAFVAPSVVVMLGLLVLPLYQTVRWSFEKVSYGQTGTFVGLSNYTGALTDPRFGRAVVFTLGLTAVVTAAVLVAGYLLAAVVDGLGRWRPVVLGILLVSYVVPGVIGATMFSWLFNPNFGGVVTHAITAVTGTDVQWFTHTWPNRVLVGADVFWGFLPFAVLLVMAGLQGVPQELVEAARVDGASRVETHWHVIIPSMRGVLGFTAIIAIMDIVRTFDALVPLSPQAVLLGNESVMLYVYNAAFQDGGQQLGLGSAINVLLIGLIVVLLLPFIRDTARQVRES